MRRKFVYTVCSEKEKEGTKELAMAPKTGKGRGNRGKGDKKKKEEKGICYNMHAWSMNCRFIVCNFDD